jgi:hypothetical protein
MYDVRLLVVGLPIDIPTHLVVNTGYHYAANF